MSVCISTDCKKYTECKRAAINNEGTHTATDKAQHISGNNNGKDEYWCGEKGNYKLFIPIK